MIARIFMALGLLVCGGAATAAEPGLSDSERQGRQVFVQSCGICHLKPTLVSDRYGPALSKATVANKDKEESVRALIDSGSQRMPGFRYEFGRTEIDALIAYLKSVPEAPPSTGNTGQPQWD